MPELCDLISSFEPDLLVETPYALDEGITLEVRRIYLGLFTLEEGQRKHGGSRHVRDQSSAYIGFTSNVTRE